MIEIKKNGRLLTYVDVYFTDTAAYHVKNKCDICTYQNIYNLHSNNNQHSLGYTLISDLSVAEDILWSKIHKTTRYEIRRAERYNLDFVVYDSSHILDKDTFNFDRFKNIYEKMFLEKGLPRSFDKEEFYSIVNANGGVVTAVTYNNIPIVYHFYICDNTHTKLTVSCSELWNADTSMDKNLIGYANKWLHWKDFLWFKESGVTSYDWGGVTWNEDNPGTLDGINKFKASFGGEQVSYYSETVLVSIKAKVYTFFKHIKN